MTDAKSTDAKSPDAKSAWHETGERFNSLGAKLKLHYEQKRGQDADQSKAEVRDALHRLTGALDDAFEAIGTAARDDAVKSDVKQVGQSLVTALGATFNQISAEVQRQYAARTGQGTPSAGGTGPAGETAPGTSAEPPVTGSATSTLTEPPAPGSAPASEGPSTEAPASEGPSTEAPNIEGESKPDGGQPPKVEPWGTP